MYTKQEIIIKHYREGKSQRQISRDLGISRKTVKKYVDAYEKYRQKKGEEEGEMVGYLSQPQEYDSRNRTRRRLTQEVQEEIDRLLAENARKLHSGLRKQMLKKADIHELLQEKGYKIGYTTVCNYIREKEQKGGEKEVYVRQEYQPGESCEFDWGETKLTIDGRLKRVYLSVFTSAWSNYRFGELYEREDTLSFMEGHVLFFAHVGGSYREMLYDNTRVAVARFTGRKEKEPTRALLQLRGHYQFTHRFCNARRGNEKGHVERSVEYVRRKVFGRRSEFATLEEARKYLHKQLERLNNLPQQLTGKSARELLEEEKKHLWPAPIPLAVSESVELRVDSYSTISYGTNRYSVPEELTGEFVKAKIYSNKLEIYYRNQRVAIHERSYERHRWIIKVEHYLKTFRRKPGSIGRSVALLSSDYLRSLYDEFFRGSPRDFIELLHYCHRHKVAEETLERTVKRLLDHTPGKITTEKIMALLGNKPAVKQDYGSKDSETVERSKEQLQKITKMLM